MVDKTTYLNELNDSQREAVVYCNGPSLVVAGAGSGKTRVLTYKIAYLLDQGYSPYSLLALTFTNKAAREMKSRIAAMLDESIVNRVWMGTFHSICYRILRYEAERIGYRPDFTIYDTADSKNLIRSIVQEMLLDEKVYQPKLIQSRISNAKSMLITSHSYGQKTEMLTYDAKAGVPFMSEIYSIYQARCFQSGVMDFDELLLQTNILFRDHPDVLAKYQEKFKYVLVDEYQDTNFAQHVIVVRLCEKHKRICVVGDDAQSIYAFRGANIDNMLRFKDYYPDLQIFKLERNYRSTQNIVNAANSLIRKNAGQIPKVVYSENEQGQKIRIIPAYSDYEEGYIIASQIFDIFMCERCAYSDFAVLYRTNAQSRIIEEALRKRNIPYRVYGGHSFYQRKEVKDVIAYFRIVVNPNDEEALKRIINYPTRGIGDTTVRKLLAAATIHQVSVWQILCNPMAFSVPISSGTLKKLTNFREMIEKLMNENRHSSADIIARMIMNESGIASELYQDRSIEGISRQENLQEVLRAVTEFCGIKREEGFENVSLSDFLIEVALITDQDEDQNENPNRVTLMTAHSAKGLEFNHVIVAGLEENLFPSARTMENPKAIEEERRLLYVAVTRAKQRCIITYAERRFRNGENNTCVPSRFLKDMDPQYLILPEKLLDDPVFVPKKVIDRDLKTYNNMNTPHLRKVEKSESARSEQVTSLNGLTVGDQVRHDRFGKGVIISLEGSGGNAKAIIEFEHLGQKTLILKYAKITRL